MAARRMIHTTRSHFQSLTHSEETKLKEEEERRQLSKSLKLKKRRIERKEEMCSIQQRSCCYAGRQAFVLHTPKTQQLKKREFLLKKAQSLFNGRLYSLYYFGRTYARAAGTLIVLGNSFSNSKFSFSYVCRSKCFCQI